MEDQIVRKIRAELGRGITTECQVVYLLVEIRKLLDRDRKNSKPYDSLRLYSDWAVHVSLTGSQARKIVIQADSFYPKLAAGTLGEKEKIDFSKMFSLITFREELGQFLIDRGLPSFLDAGWNSFLASFLNVIEDCPLFCKTDDAPVRHVDEVVVIRVPRDPTRIPDGSTQDVYWGLCYKGKFTMSIGGNFELSEEVEKAINAFIEAREVSSI